MRVDLYIQILLLFALLCVLFSGLYGKDNGIDAYSKLLSLKDSIKVLPEILQENGYFTSCDLIHNKIDHITQSIDELKQEMETAHTKTDENLSFIKENLFNPHEGLWAETKLNSQFRKDSQKWRGVIGTGFVGLLFKHIWDMFKVS